MKITDVKVTNVSFGRRERPISNSILTYADQNISILQVATDEGITGLSFGGHKNLVEGSLKRVVLGEDPFDVEGIWQKMYQSWRKPVAKGDIIAAMSGIDVALWDIIGQAVNKPVHKVLGGFRDKIYVYAAGGYYEEGKGIKELVEEMTGYGAMGFKAVKMKVGRLSLKEDVERVRAVRQAIGDDIELMIDANNAFTAYEAIRFAHACEPFHPYWFEEPVPADDIQGSIEVSQATDIPIASGENEYTRWGFRDLIERRAVDILQADVGICGGITEWRKIAAMASAHHIPMSPHGNPYMSVHSMASVPNALIMETYPTAFSQMTRVAPFFEVKDSYIDVPQKPGLGIEIDWQVVEKYKVS